MYDSETGRWNEASYYVVEDAPDGVLVTYKSDEGKAVESGDNVSAADGSVITIINIDNLVDLNILKVDSNGMTKPLKGAKFTIQQFDETSSVISLIGSPVNADTTGTDGTGSDGIASFTDLKAGYYIITETKIPDGYVQTGTGVFNIKVDNGSVSLIEKGESGWTVSEGSAKLTFTAASADSPATVTVGNDSGSALPSTGSRGTAIYYIAGFALIALASVFPVAKLIKDR